MDLKRNEFHVITEINQIRGKRFNESEIIYIDGKKFDYPLSACDRKTIDKYRNLIFEMNCRVRKDN